MLWQILTNLGFSEKESKAYLSLLELGTQPASVVAKKAGINRSTCYLVLEELIKKGLVSMYTRSSVSYFSAQEPSALFIYLQNLTQDIEDQKRYLEDNINALHKVNENMSFRPKVEFYEGLEGLKSVYADTLNTDKIYAFNNVNIYPPALKKYILEEYIPLRIEMGIPIDTIGTPQDTTHNKKQLRRSRFMPNNLGLEIEINIYVDRVAFMSYLNEQYMGVIIQNKLISDAMRNIHQTLWPFLPGDKD